MPINNAFGEWGQGAAPSALDGPRSVSPSPSPTGGGVLPGPMPSAGGGGGGGGASMSQGALDPGGGGGYPSAGGGGASDGSGASVAQGFDDGGDVGETEDGAIGASQGADAATIDPMQAITKTLAYGRKKFGLPQNFSDPSGGQQSFDDGGVVQTGDQQSQEAPLPDPRQALQYLTGAGNLSPDIAGALEKHVDPQGTMSPAQRALTAISAAPSPDAAFGMMQHYRTRYNAYSGGAKASLDQGNLAHAAVHATQAMSAVPTGYDVQFAPANGGVAMSAKKIGGQPQQQAMDDGGQVEDQYAGLPDSENVEDRRDEGAGNKSADVMDSYAAQSESNTRPYENRSRNKQRGKALDQEQSFADGGEVDDEEGVIPDQPQADVSDTDDEGDAAPTDQTMQQAMGTQDQSQPVILTPEQFKQMMSAGYDKPLDDGWGSFIGKILGSVNPVSSAEAMPYKAAQRGQQQQATKTTTGTNPDVMAAAAATQAETGGDTAGAGAPTPQQRPAGAAQQAPGPGAVGGAGGADSAQPGEPKQTTDQRLDAYQKRIEAQAWKIYPYGGVNDDKRTAYIAKQMEAATGSEFKQDQEAGKGKLAIEGLKVQGRNSLATMQEMGRNGRNANTNDTKRDIHEDTQANLNDRALQGQIARAANSIRMNNPNTPPEEMIKQLAIQFGITPKAVQQHLMGGQGAGGGQGGGQGGQQGQQGNGSLEPPKIGAVRPVTKNGVTRHYTFQNDGQWHLVPEKK